MQDVPLAPLGLPITGKRLGYVMEHRGWLKWRRKYPNVGAYLKANPGPLGEFRVDQWWLEHYQEWLDQALFQSIPGKTPAEKAEWVVRVKGEVALALARVRA